MPRAVGVLILVAALAACSASSNRSGFIQPGDGSGDGSDGGFVGSFGGGSNEGGAGAAACAPNPLNFDIPGNGCDDDGNGAIDDTPTCDTSLTPSGGAGDFAKALGLCQAADGAHWGIVSTAFTHDYGQSTPVNDGQHGILGQFGAVVKPREGASLGVLSSGYGLEYDCNASGCSDPFQGGQPMQDNGTVPAGFPKAAQGCAVTSDVHDVIDYQLTLKVPANAQGLQFDFDFWSGEWPEWVCTKYNDGFIAFLKSGAQNGGTPDNISFDAKNNPVSVNNGFFDRCTQNATVGCNGNNSGTMACASGPAELQGTGFYQQDMYCGTTPTTGGGATGWLTSQAPVLPGETITLDFIIWDTHDQQYDSSVLLDHLTWAPGPVTTGTSRPPPR